MFDPVDLDRLKAYLVGSPDTVREALAHLEIRCDRTDDEIEDRLLVAEVEICTNCGIWRDSEDILEDGDFVYCIECQ